MMASRPTQKVRAAGFSLIEMMVALFIFSIIAASGITVLSSAIQSKDQMTERQSLVDALVLARAIMKADFVQIANRPVRLDRNRGDAVGFTGGDVGESEPVLLFVRRGWLNPGHVEPRSSLQTVEYWLEDDMLKRRAYDRVDAVSDTPSRERILLRGVSKFELSFYRNGQWAAQWTASGPVRSLPTLIAVDMELAGIGPVRQVFLTPELEP